MVAITFQGGWRPGKASPAVAVKEGVKIISSDQMGIRDLGGKFVRPNSLRGQCVSLSLLLVWLLRSLVLTVVLRACFPLSECSGHLPQAVISPNSTVCRYGNDCRLKGSDVLLIFAASKGQTAMLFRFIDWNSGCSFVSTLLRLGFDCCW